MRAGTNVRKGSGPCSLTLAEWRVSHAHFPDKSKRDQRNTLPGQDPCTHRVLCADSVTARDLAGRVSVPSFFFTQKSLTANAGEGAVHIHPTTLRESQYNVVTHINGL